ncbi:unnamed protein product [Heligmosomoides polygyrus]|uniref:PLAT domain-containing protein n=1 Tax=Heligmosomoides polygyrus TaxID=6339 RepID=A0A183GDA3_HELPZ|nr:unnamed protein product [Heligmosomoides polygyrus]
MPFHQKSAGPVSKKLSEPVLETAYVVEGNTAHMARQGVEKVEIAFDFSDFSFLERIIFVKAADKKGGDQLLNKSWLLHLTGKGAEEWHCCLRVNL